MRGILSTLAPEGEGVPKFLQEGAAREEKIAFFKGIQIVTPP